MKKTLLLAFVSMFALQAHAATQDLINSVKEGNFADVVELLNNGEDVNGTDASGTTALHYAVAMDNPDITTILLSYGADLSIENLKGWTPLKIAEKKDLKNVTPILAQYVQWKEQMQAKALSDEDAIVAEAKNVEKTVKEVPAQAKQISEDKITAVIENVTADIPQAVPVDEVVTKNEKVVETEKTVEQAEEPVADKIVEDMEKQIDEVKEAVEVSTDNYQKVMEQAAQAVIEARTAQTKAEAESKIMADELKQLKNEKAKLEAELAEKSKQEAKSDEQKTKDVEEAQVKSEVASEAKKDEEKKVASAPKKNEVKKTTPAPKTIKPVLQKKPTYKAPQPIVKKVVIKPSAMVDGIYAGDEEIVYCLDYLGNGENDNMKRAAGYFAASASISEARYKQIVDKANEYFTKANDADMTKRDNECSKIITPNSHDKQNQIVRSINKSVGY